jgi:DNA-binding NarL/FixJ family response regulator
LEAAAGAARAAIAWLDAAKREDPFLDVLLPSAEALIAAGTADEAASSRARLRLLLGQFVQHVPDEDLRVRWFRGPLGRQLAALAGPLDVPAAGSASAPARLAEEEIRLLRLVSQGHTNREIADSVGTAEETVTRKLVELYEKIGVSSRADATAAALLGKLV